MTRSATLFLLALLPALAAIGAAPASAAEAPIPGEVQFNRDVRPILSANCFFCHGPDPKQRKAGLRLDVEADATAQRKSGIAVKPGDLAASTVWQRITTADPEEHMPPAESKKTLSKRDVAVLKKWIEQGAKYEGHWAFIAPVKPDLPQVTDKAWPRSPIDHFVLARLEAAGLKPAPEADRATLVRRVALDLTGLPPTLAELDRFLADQSDNGYERLVDYYLNSEAYGERMALAWMDAARYGDTSVFHADGPRDMWPWRDWVIKAYNSNMPFDRFTVEQIGGDLLPNADVYQKIASGFLRNNGTTDEGGAIAEEYRVEYVVDRVKTVGNVWLGMSVECGQCHSHKYDPLSQEEYYSLFAFFNVSADGGMQTRGGNAAPLINVPDPAKDAERAEKEKQVAALDERVKQHVASVEPAFAKWIEDATVKAKLGDQPSVPTDMLAYLTFDERQGDAVGDSVDANRKGKFVGTPQWVDGKFAGAIKLNGNDYIDFGNLGDFDRTDSFSYGCWVRPEGKNPNGVPIGKMNEGDNYRGYDLFIAGGNVAVHIVNTWPGNAVKVTTKNKLKVNEWTHVFATYDGSSKASGVKIYFNGVEQEWGIEQDGLSGTTKTNVPLKIGRRNNSAQFTGLVDDVRLYPRKLEAAEVAALAGSDPIGPILAVDPAQRTPTQVETLRTHYLNTIDVAYKKLQQDKAKLSAEIEGLKKTSVTSMIMEDTQRKTYLLMRGNYASPDTSKEIAAGTPAFLPPMADDMPRNRLGLAQWLVSKRHPLTARVTVNRHWSMLFGQGIVTTLMDFGSQGQWPSHPQLLDWLATDFEDSAWDVKRSIKQMMMSATYRQSSRATPEKREADPLNTLLSRGPRFRLQAEFIRDQALALSGLLVEQVGGPGVKPYQPPGLWNEVSLDGGLRFKQDQGEKLYRRSMYIYWKRSAPHPGMMILDAPTREKCTVDRPRTNTPLQALYTLNDPQFVEASRMLAQRVMKEAGATPEARAAFAYRLATAQQPSKLAVETLVDLYNSELSKYRGDAAKAKQLLDIGESKRDETLDPAEHAAWTIVASTILNLDATMSKF